MNALLCLALVLVPLSQAGDLLTDETIAGRRLTRFQVGHPENQACWERHGVDGFFSIIDAHNHFRPFYGPPVPWDMYMNWLHDHGILFSTMLGIGQKLKKKNKDAPECCYYLHCATFDFPVTPDTSNDIENAKDFISKYKDQPLSEKIHLIPSVTFPNLQQPENNSRNLGVLESTYQGVFKWAGEINVFKHALAANGFFENGNRVNEEYIKSGKLNTFFKRMEDVKWPTTLHCDLGCDNYDKVPLDTGCVVPQEELDLAKRNYRWWKDFLGPYFGGFFDSSNTPKQNFKKIQHLKIWDTLLTTYPNMTVVWAHLGLSKELKHLHPTVHAYIIDNLFSRHQNLYADISWDVLSKQLLMNFNGANVSLLHHDVHEDLNGEIKESVVDTEEVEEMREELEETWDIHEDMMESRGSVSGPTHAMAIYLELFHAHADRFLTGTDFVSSLGPPDEFPGLVNGKGCMKDKKNHARQVTDTGSINMFLNDEAFQKIVLGGNYFKINRLEDTFAPPPVCGDSLLPMEALIGIGVGAGVLLIIIIVVLVVLCCCRKKDKVSFVRVDGPGSATTRV
eukprot:TRINITY_DN3243_c0_g1_i3.p1 TRINITY_DN3243_c0_g1~~TRINITY_DN3243_c0_g1_i3.p1  ORF type:complete len:565 (-),score=165.35 TRINITY_DN3243_c0_g1_i3:132-1826(-)